MDCDDESDIALRLMRVVRFGDMQHKLHSNRSP